MIKIEMPTIQLRPYQIEAWNALHEGCDEHENFTAMVVWHRRAGKDLFYLQFMLSKAMEIIGNYWFLLPESLQVRNAIWEGITKDGEKYMDMIPEQLVFKKDNQSMKVYLKHPTKRDKKGNHVAGSIISFLGGDRYDKRVGAGLQGAVISEYALQKPNLYDLALEPMLSETKGWAIFNTTPRGDNHAKTMFEYMQKDPNCYTSLLTIKETTDSDGVALVTEQSLDKQRARGKMEEIIQQEY
ncbi:hypothetical protein KAR91_68175, partial [Candidatus Pacearchaeota archaeon]|nr:hypothetical protein [Candidatus Pacearchaeota archaeon]